MNYDHNRKFGLLKFHWGYGNFYVNSPKGYTWKIINAHTDTLVFKSTGYYLSACANRRDTICPHVQKWRGTICIFYKFNTNHIILNVSGGTLPGYCYFFWHFCTMPPGRKICTLSTYKLNWSKTANIKQTYVSEILMFPKSDTKVSECTVFDNVINWWYISKN